MGADLPSSAAEEHGLTQVIAGQVEEILGQSMIVRVGGQSIEVSVASAKLSRGADGSLTSHMSYMKGDDVVVSGDWSGTGFDADEISTIYLPFEGKVLKRVGNRLDTDMGTIYVVPGTKGRGHDGIFRPAATAHLGPGDVIAGLVFKSSEIPAGSLVAAVLGVR